MNNRLLRVAIVGITGRMGREVAKQLGPDMKLSAAICSKNSPSLGKNVRDLGIAPTDLIIRGPDAIGDTAFNSDVVVSFTNPEAELENVPRCASASLPVVLGTTGFTPDQLNRLLPVLNKCPSVLSPNFSVGANVLFHLATMLSRLPPGFDISIVEAHHSGKADAPSGTAKRLSEIIMDARKYNSIVTGRSGVSRRSSGELEVLSIRAGGIVGKHTILSASQNELLTLDHEVFSRAAFASGALVAARWVVGKKPGVYGMEEVLGLN